jgi:two-component system sensor histidine kinase RegB
LLFDHRHAERRRLLQRRRRQPAGLAAAAAGRHRRADLPARFVAVIAGAAIAAYSLLMFFFVPLPLPTPPAPPACTWRHVADLRRLGRDDRLDHRPHDRLIRQRDAELAAAREQALRDERVMAMGTLAAGAAHELGTPLGTMALLAGELANDASLSDPVREDIALLRQQIGVCKEIITGLSRRAGAERLENAQSLAADRWLDSLRQRWHAARPQASSRLIVASDGRHRRSSPTRAWNRPCSTCSTMPPTPRRARWKSASLVHGHAVHRHPRPRPGLPARGPRPRRPDRFPAHERGSGVGLMLTRAAIEQLGGTLTLSNPDDGGALARIELPRANMSELTLIIDDDPSFNAILVRTLERRGHPARGALDAASALEAARERRPGASSSTST